MDRVFWLQGITCNGNSHSFVNLSTLPALLKNIAFIYHPLLDSFCFNKALEQDFDILIVEGGIKRGWQRGGVEFEELFVKLASKAKRVIAVGSCAVYGGIFKEYDKAICGVLFDKEKKSCYFEKFKDKTINIPGCPAHPEWIAYALTCQKPHLDEYFRPKELFAYTVHAGCVRNEYFEWKVDAKSFGLKEGCLFYEQGCQAPYTHGSCNKILWNEVASKTRVGTPCFGCTEPDFIQQDLFHTKTFMSIPAKMPLGVPKRAYLTLTGVAKSFAIERLSKRLIDD